MNDTPPLLELVQKILRDDPRAAIILAEIISPPPGLESSPTRIWDEA